jgi:Zn-dependent protease with chaperone function
MFPGEHGAAPAAFAAELMDGASADARTVLVTVLEDRLELSTAPGLEVPSWSISGLHVDPHAEGVLQLTHADHPGALLSSSDPAFREVLAAAGAVPVRSALRDRLGHAALYAAAIASVVGLFAWMLPGISAGIARRVPPGIEEQLAFPVHKLLEGRYCRTPASRDALARLAQRLRVEGDPLFAEAHLEVVDLPVVNALTFPGGSVVVTDALVQQAGDPDELAGVLAHELEHVARRHIMAQVVRSVILTTGWHLTAGDFAGLMAIDPSTTLEIASRSFSREAEREADQGALRRLRSARISTGGLARFFARFEEDTDRIPEWLSTHPASALRRQAIGDKESERMAPALSAKEWEAVRKACAVARRGE